MKNTIFYKKLIAIYSDIIENYRQIENKSYRKTVEKLFSEGKIELKANSLENIIKNKSDITYYVIRRDNPSIGLLTYVSVFLGHIAYAIEKGYIPIIDMQSFKSIYLKEEDIGKKNAWEFYFEQPFNIGLDDIGINDKVVYSPKYTQPMSPFVNSLLDSKESVFWNTIAKKYIKLNKSTNDYINNERETLLKDKRILGLLYRGTDYQTLKPRNHPIQPSLELFSKTIKANLLKWGDFDGYYLATDDYKAFDFLKNEFPGKIITNKRTYYDKFINIRYLAEAKFDRNNDEYLKGLEYLSSIILLSSSESLIASSCAGTYAANFFRKKEFTHTYFFNLGLYR